ncbi:hypothetical protein ES703_29798 [subsurface metagenome]
MYLGVLTEYNLGENKIEDKMFYRLFGIEDVVCMRRLLPRGGVFVDVGANIGHLSAIAGGIVGTTGEVHCFEPVPEYYRRLRILATNNPRYRIITNNCALGDMDGTVRMRVCTTGNIGRNTIVGDWMGVDATREIEVPIRRLDSYLREHNIERINLIKIDTEGYEVPVIRGLSGYFENTSQRPPIICEVTPKAASAFDATPDEVRKYLTKYGYQMFDIMTWEAMSESDFAGREEGTFDVLFMRSRHR